jgi:hypothetical protein
VWVIDTPKASLTRRSFRGMIDGGPKSGNLGADAAGDWA